MRFFLLLIFPAIAWAGDPVNGKAVALARGDANCLLCHTIPGSDRLAGNIGPSLAQVGVEFTVEDLRARIIDASRFNPGTVMPPYGRTEDLHQVAPQYRGKPLLTPAEIDDLVAFLLTLK